MDLHKRSATGALEDMASCFRKVLSHVGEDVNRQGLLKTPERAANAMLFFTKGYDENLDSRLLKTFFTVSV